MYGQVDAEQTLGKPVVFQKTFKNNGEDFSGINEAETFVKALGLTTGSMQRGAPIGLAKDAEYISKWDGMTREDRKQLDGLMVADSFRNGDVTVYLTFKTE